jgi:hypothetical protein
VAFIGNNKAAKSSSMQIFDLFHGLLYLAVAPYRNGFLAKGGSERDLSSQKLPCRTSPPTVGATTMGSLAIPDFGFGETPLWENRK